MKHTGLPLEKVERSMERDMFMSPVEAQSFGMIDKILTSPPKNKVGGGEESEGNVNSDANQEKK